VLYYLLPTYLFTYLLIGVQIVATRSGDVDMVSLLVDVAAADVNKASYVARYHHRRHHYYVRLLHELTNHCICAFVDNVFYDCFLRRYRLSRQFIFQN